MRVLVLALCVGVLLTGTLAATPALLGESQSDYLTPVLSALETEAQAGGPLPVCLFVHGLGQSPKVPDRLYHGFFPVKEYWGSTIQDRVGKKCDVWYLHYNSQTRAWTDKTLQNDVCKFVKESKARIVFTHSMGNNVIGGAIANGNTDCNFAPAPSAADWKKGGVKVPADKRVWVSLQGVFGGSVASDACVSICAATSDDLVTTLKKDFKITDLKKIGDIVKELGAEVASVIPKARQACVCNKGKAGAAIASCSYAQTKPDQWAALTKAAREYAWRQMCGISPISVRVKLGQALFMPIPYALLAGLKGWGNDLLTSTVPPYSGTDGFVSWTSCRAGRDPLDWLPSYKERFYFGKMNHADGTGRTEDGATLDKMPMSFIAHAAEQLVGML